MTTQSPLPEPHTVEDIYSILNDIHSEIHELHAQQKALVESHNEVGQNIAWIVANTQGIFEMFNSPAMMGQMMSMVGGAFGGGRGPAEQPGE